MVQTQRTRTKERPQAANPPSLERDVRQLLADKISGNQAGIWLLVPEHLRLGTWDLLRGWCGEPTERVEPRLALHLVNEAAMCQSSFRHRRSLSQKGFELANGLPFVPTDGAIHELLESHTVAESRGLQIALGKLRRAGRHFRGRLLALDPHRMRSFSQRQMRRHRFNSEEKPAKMGQGFFLLDCDTDQPVCFSLASSAAGATAATPDLLAMAAEILSARPGGQPKPLVLADKEHYAEELFAAVREAGCFDLLCPQPLCPGSLKRWGELPLAGFTEHWPGYATATQPHHFKDAPGNLYHELVQRSGLRAEDLQFQGFLATGPREELQSLTKDYPQRWDIEEFFKCNQALGWRRAGTLNLHIRYAQMTMALIAQAAIHQLRLRLGEPAASWDAEHFARNLFGGLEGDIRVSRDTVLVTYYNAPNAELLRTHYEDLPEKLRQQGIEPRIPWLYDFHLDFRFK
jgi:hypothetical protein